MPSIVQIQPLFLEIDSRSQQLSMTSRQVVKLRCLMDLTQFPFDTQQCNIEFSLLAIPNDRVHLVWDRFKLSLVRSSPNFFVINKKTDKCQSLRGKDYSCISAHMKLFRNVSYYVTRIYAPSFLLVLVAFVGFWIPPCGYPARVAVIVTPLLSLITQQAQINGEVNVSYIVAIHIWMIMSIIFVFMSLIEYTATIIYVHVVDEKKTVSIIYSSFALNFDLVDKFFLPNICIPLT